MATNIEDKSPKKISSEKIYDSIIDTIGNTPIVKLCRLPKTAGCKAEILCKLEFFNPLASVKDRIGRAMSRKKWKFNSWKNYLNRANLWKYRNSTGICSCCKRL